MAWRRQTLGFLFAGTVGFGVDAAVLLGLHELAELDLLPSRLCSFAVAVTATWLLNRHLTFGDRRPTTQLDEWGRYVLVNSLGAGINMAVFFWLVARWPEAPLQPLTALAVASLIAMCFNFFASKHFAFRYHRLRAGP
jgi:putative flippase GtrA